MFRGEKSLVFIMLIASFCYLTCCGGVSSVPSHAGILGTGSNGGMGSGSSSASGSGSGSGGTSGSGNGGSNSKYVTYLFMGYAGSTNPGQAPNALSQYGADANGALTGVASTAPTGLVSSMASTPQYLFVAENPGFVGQPSTIVTYPLASQGSLSPSSTLAASSMMLSVDRAGQTLYSWGGSGAVYQSYSIGANGALTPVNSVPAQFSTGWNALLSFTPNDGFAYTSDCPNTTPIFYGYTRTTNGALTAFDTKANLPTGFSAANGPPGSCTTGAAVAGNQYVVFALQPDSSTVEFAVYTINSDGTLRTTDTSATMPTITTGQIGFYDYAFDPSGTWLAACNSAGLYLYNFANGKLTLTDSLPINNGPPPAQLLWDASDHIYYSGQSSAGFGGVIEFSVSSSGKLTQLPISATSGVPGDGIMAVQPLQ